MYFLLVLYGSNEVLCIYNHELSGMLGWAAAIIGVFAQFKMLSSLGSQNKRHEQHLED